ncbi:hypothetical protein D3C72_1849750 [compost metagenome]
MVLIVMRSLRFLCPRGVDGYLEPMLWAPAPQDLTLDAALRRLRSSCIELLPIAPVLALFVSGASFAVVHNLGPPPMAEGPEAGLGHCRS